MAHTDARGLTITTASALAAERYVAAVELMLAAWPGADRLLDEALAADPDFALAHAARARVHAMAAQPAETLAALSRALSLAGSVTPRERSHIEIIGLVLRGEAPTALKQSLAHAEAWPRDATILGLPLGAFGLFAFSGMADHDQARVDLCERHARYYAKDDTWFLTASGWAYVENRAVDRGRRMLEASLLLQPRNANTAHALAHGLFEAGEMAASEAFIEDWLPGYETRGVLHGHLAWHAALAALEQGEAERALAHYDRHVCPAVSQGMPINIVTDGISLLWRLDALGHAGAAERWGPVATLARRAFPRPGHAFVDAHMALLEAAQQDEEAASLRIAALKDLIADGRLPAGAVCPALCEAALAFATGNHARCVEVLEAHEHEVARIGGSGAQRQVFEDTLIIALLRAGRIEQARRRLDDRLHRRPSERDSAWRAAALA